MKLSMNYAWWVVLTAAVAAALVTTSAKKDTADTSGELSPTIDSISHHIAVDVDRVTMAKKMKPFLTVKDLPKLGAYVQEMENIINTAGKPDSTSDEFYKNISSLRLNQEEILEHWDILMQPINISGKQEKLFMYLWYVNRYFSETISTAEFIDENWELLLGTSSDPRTSDQISSSYEGSLFDEMRVFYHPTFWDAVLRNHIWELIQWHFDDAKSWFPSLSDPLWYWLTTGKGIISWNDIAPFQELIEQILLLPRERQWTLIRLLRRNNFITDHPYPLPQPLPDTPLSFSR